ncbi:HlyD family efflux transporter periplasmic adaptor subunit [Chitinophaga sp. SYP-B3965]|uniref:efflux RND transporter periplasmic adaptor subunit n=1 Tax=Chitinophaga sp. SYP-B3965 TaxID=2663120 RepID=UPI0012999D6D|nr:efflux RND transporter periplasmic adaptor subunit [Chitinophaga sp. SYP-B3965]MRG46288.1 HlyD family efflux transporter periplasmic adaptor subunit [Chitinophaga sp. SYP-B3965]
MKKKLLYWIIGGLVALIVVIAVVKGTGKDDGIKVATDKAAKKDIIEVVSASGKVYPEIEVKVSSDVSGEITDLLVLEGDSVQKGQVLARIYADVYGSMRDRAAAAVSQSEADLANSTAGLNAFKARLDQAKFAFDRNSELLKQKVISNSEFETAEATYKAALADYNAASQRINSSKFAIASAQANLTEANKNLGRTTILSPMTGSVSLLSVKKGERVVGTAQMTGTEMLRIADMSTMEVQVDVGENDIPKVKFGDSAIIEVDAYNNRKFKGVVTQIASSSKGAATSATTSAEQVTNYIVHIRIAPSSYADLIGNGKNRRFPFRPGMSASVDIQTRTEKLVLSIPINAVTTRNPEDTVKNKTADKNAPAPPSENTGEEKKDFKEVVFVLQKDGTVKLVEVTTGIQDDTNIEIKTGLKDGEEVISGPYTAISKTLENGKKVKVVPKAQLFEGAKK